MAPRWSPSLVFPALLSRRHQQQQQREGLSSLRASFIPKALSLPPAAAKEARRSARVPSLWERSAGVLIMASTMAQASRLGLGAAAAVAPASAQGKNSRRRAGRGVLSNGAIASFSGLKATTGLPRSAPSADAALQRAKLSQGIKSASPSARRGVVCMAAAEGTILRFCHSEFHPLIFLSAIVVPILSWIPPLFTVCKLHCVSELDSLSILCPTMTQHFSCRRFLFGVLFLNLEEAPGRAGFMWG